MKLRCKWAEGCKPRFKEGDAGLDLRVRSIDNVHVLPGEVVEIDTGLNVEFPNGYCGMVLPRSSTGREGLEIANTVPLIDSQYTGRIEIYVKSRVPMTLEPFERFAQLVILPYYQVTQLEYGDPQQTERGDGSFGSTGKK